MLILTILFSLAFYQLEARSQDNPIGVNPILDITISAPSEPPTSSVVYDESIAFSPNFAINQNDPALSDLFSTNGVSHLCFPSTLAEDLIYLFAYHQPQFNNFHLDGLSSDGQTIDPNAVVRQMVSLCKTDPNHGTNSANEINCALAMIGQAGYSVGSTELISPYNQNINQPIYTRIVTLSDIRLALKKGSPVLMEVAWFAYDPILGWVNHGAHHIGIYGYDYNESWGENQLQVRVVNPETVYDTSRQNALWDTVMISRAQAFPGTPASPPNRPFVLSGPGFNDTIKGYIETILVISPDFTK